MFDPKIGALLVPLWLATVLATLYMGLTRPKLHQAGKALFSYGANDISTAITARTMGLSPFWERLLLGHNGPLHRMVLAQRVEKKTPGEASPAGENKYYVNQQQREKLQAMFFGTPTSLALSVFWCLVLTVFFFALWIVTSLVFDTSGLPVWF